MRSLIFGWNEEGRRACAAAVDHSPAFRPVDGGRHLRDYLVGDGEEGNAAAIDDGLGVSLSAATGNKTGKTAGGRVGAAGDGIDFPSSGGEGDCES